MMWIVYSAGRKCFFIPCMLMYEHKYLNPILPWMRATVSSAILSPATRALRRKSHQRIVLLALE